MLGSSLSLYYYWLMDGSYQLGISTTAILYPLIGGYLV